MSLQTAIEYGKYGWMVFPILPKSKAPACKGGFHDARKDPKGIAELWGNQTNFNIGIATGEISGIWALDVDPDKGGEESLTVLENKYGSLPETLISRTGGGGKHYIFKTPKHEKISCSIGKLAKGIDIRGNGGYIAAPPSIHPNGQQYQWEENEIAEAPEWLIKLILALKQEPVAKTEGKVQGDWTINDVTEMLEVIPADERDVWINVGMALQEGGWPVTVWDTWSRKSEKYKTGETFRIWKGFKNTGGITMGTLVQMALDLGWKPPPKPYEELDFSNVDGVDLSAFKKKISDIPLPEAETKIAIGGLIGDTLTWINSTAIKLQPELSLMNTIAALGAIFGRRYALQKLNTRTNLYMIGIAETGQGKDNSRVRIKELMKAAGLEQFSGPDGVRSAHGLLSEIKKRPSFLLNLDEVGMFMRAIFDQKAPIYYREISSIFTQMYSRSGSSYESGLTASNPDERLVLYEPNLCIYGTTTLNSYAEAMRSNSIKSGELNRFIVLKSSIDYPEPNFAACVSEPPEALVSRWSKFKVQGLAAAPDIIEQEKIIVQLGECEKTIQELYKFQDSMQKEYRASGLDALWVRYRENILKIAMIVAICRDPSKPVIINSDLDFGKSLVASSIRFMIKFASDNMYDSGFQKLCHEFMEAVKSGVDNRTIMLRRLGVKAKELDDIERTLKESAKITFDEKERPKHYFLQ